MQVDDILCKLLLRWRVPTKLVPQGLVILHEQRKMLATAGEDIAAKVVSIQVDGKKRKLRQQIQLFPIIMCRPAVPGMRVILIIVLMRVAAIDAIISNGVYNIMSCRSVMFGM